MQDESSIYSRIETGYGFTPDVNKKLVKNSIQVILHKEVLFQKIKYYSPKNLTVQHLPVKEREKKIEIIRMRNGYIIDTLTSVDIQEDVKIGSEVIQIYEGVIYRETF